MGYGLWCGFVVVVCGLHRKIRLTQLWVELSWVMAIFLMLLNIAVYNPRGGWILDNLHFLGSGGGLLTNS